MRTTLLQRQLHIAATAIALVSLAAGTAACSGPRMSTYQGYVEGEFVYLGSSQSGHLEQLAVSRGLKVQAGTPLFTLEAVDERAGQLQAAQQLSAAEAQLADIQTGKRRPELAVIHAQVLQARAMAQRSEQQRTRDEAQYRAGGISKEQLDATVAQASSDAARLSELENQLEVARLPGRDQQLKAQDSQIQAARAALAQAQWRLEQKSVSAPQAGLVYDTLYRQGEWVPAGGPVVRMLPPQNIKVRFFVPESALGAIELGRKVTLHCDGCAADISASISFVSSEAEYTPPVIYSNETRGKLIYMIEARPAPEDAGRLHPGQPVAVQLP